MKNFESWSGQGEQMGWPKPALKPAEPVYNSYVVLAIAISLMLGILVTVNRKMNRPAPRAVSAAELVYQQAAEVQQAAQTLR